jgi:hypothetical protein
VRLPWRRERAGLAGPIVDMRQHELALLRWLEARPGCRGTHQACLTERPVTTGRPAELKARQARYATVFEQQLAGDDGWGTMSEVARRFTSKRPSVVLGTTDNLFLVLLTPLRFSGAAHLLKLYRRTASVAPQQSSTSRPAAGSTGARKGTGRSHSGRNRTVWIPHNQDNAERHSSPTGWTQHEDASHLNFRRVYSRAGSELRPARQLSGSTTWLWRPKRDRSLARARRFTCFAGEKA